MAVSEEFNPEGKSSPEMSPVLNGMGYSLSLKNTFIEAEVQEAPQAPGLKRSQSVPVPAHTPPRGPEQHEAFEVSPEKVEDPKGACSEPPLFLLPRAASTDGDGEEQAKAHASCGNELPAGQCEEHPPLVGTVSHGAMVNHSVDGHSAGQPVPVPEVNYSNSYDFNLLAQQHIFAGMQPPAATMPYQGDNPWTYAAPSPVMAAGATAPCQEPEQFAGTWGPTPAPQAMLPDVAAWHPCANAIMWSQFVGGVGYAPPDKSEAEVVTMPGAEGSVHGWWPHPQVQMWPLPSQAPPWQPGVQMPANAQVAMVPPGPHPQYFTPSGQLWGPPPPPPDPVPESTCTGFMSHNEQTLRSRHAQFLTRAQGALWIVDAKKLTQNYKQAVSPEFRITFGSGPSGREVVFKLIIYPRTHADGGKKGSGSFKKTRGRGVVQLKCDSVLNDAAGAEVTFSIGIGSPDEAAEHQMRGPVLHNFAQSAVCGLEKSEEEWDFQQAVDNSGTFGVSLEIAMGRAERRVK